MNLLSCLILGTLACSVLLSPRKWAAVALVVGTLYLTQGAGFEVIGFNFSPTRLLGYLSLARVISRGEFSFSKFTRVDNTFLFLYGFTTVILLTRPEEAPALRFAKLLDVISVYIAFRAFITTPVEFRWLLGVMGLLLVPYVVLLAIESGTRNNLFALVGADTGAWVREGKLRCLGSFRHPSLLGSLGACTFPLFVGLLFDPTLRHRSILAVTCCVGIVYFSNSGGPVSVLAMSVVGWLLWPLRYRMQAFRLSLLVLVAVLALFMRSPIWYLPAKVSSLTGGTGWHRSYLMDLFFHHIGKWWLVGMPVAETGDWFPYTLVATGGADITNQFISFGLSSGIAGLALFIVLIVRAFSHTGRALATVREGIELQGQEPLLWGLGVALAAHVTNWFGITYFDQFNVIWLLELAALVSVSEFYVRKSEDTRTELSR